MLLTYLFYISRLVKNLNGGGGTEVRILPGG